MKRLALIIATTIALLPCLGYTAAALPFCTAVRYREADYTVCTAKPGRDDIRLFLNDRNGKAHGGFSSIASDLGAGKTLVFAMNAGMYHAGLDPVGLYIENGRELKRVNLRGGPGNFHMRPNGVFYIAGNTAGVMEAGRFARSGIRPRYATQSGPMLVIDGKLHPKILANGVSAKLRNGVGVDRNGNAHFVISGGPVTFHAFAGLFRDRLGCANALFFDGSVSALYAPEIGRTADPFIQLGPIVGVVAPSR